MEKEERMKSLKSMLYVIDLARNAAKHCHNVVRLDNGTDCIESEDLRIAHRGFKKGSYQCPACELRLAIKRHDRLHEEMRNTQHTEKQGSAQHAYDNDNGAEVILRIDRMREQAMDEEQDE